MRRPAPAMLAQLRRWLASHPLTLAPLPAIALAVTLLAVGGELGAWLGGSPNEVARLERENERLHRLLEQLKQRLAEAESRLALQNEQIKRQQRELDAQQEAMQPLRRQLSMLEHILLKRRDHGTHLLTASAHWQQDHALRLNLVLVKGGNYPREVEGTIELLALRPDGTVETVPFGRNRKTLPYRMRTHAIIDETIPWPRDWRPRQLVVVVRDRHRHEIARISVWLAAPTESGAKSPTEEEAG